MVADYDGGFGHPGHHPISKDLKESIILVIIVSIIFIVILAFASASGNSTVSSNYATATAGASAIFVITIFVATYEVLQYFVTHGIGKPESRDHYGG